MTRALVRLLIAGAAAVAILAAQSPEPTTAEEFHLRATRMLAERQYDRVIADCTKALELQPDLTEALQTRANAYAATRQPLLALRDIDAVIQSRPRSGVYQFRASLQLQLNRNESAIQDYSEAIRRNPSNAYLYTGRSYARERIGDTAGAAEDRAKATELGAKTPPPQTPTTASNPVSSGGPIAVGPGVTPPSVLKRIEPKYSEEARQAKISGSVVLALTVDETGSPRDIRVLRPLGYGLDEKAIEAVQHWKFAPATKDGKPVAIFSNIEVTFKLL